MLSSHQRIPEVYCEKRNNKRPLTQHSFQKIFDKITTRIN